MGWTGDGLGAGLGCWALVVVPEGRNRWEEVGKKYLLRYPDTHFCRMHDGRMPTTTTTAMIVRANPEQ